MAGVDRLEQLLTWQRMYELSVEVWKVTDTPPSSRDFNYREQIRDASDSAERNVAEGFGRYNPGEFARFLDVSRASAQETRVLLKKGLTVGYLSTEQFQYLDALAVRGLQALARFQRYLRSPAAKRNAERNRHRRRRPNTRVTLHTSEPAPHSHTANGANDPNAPNDPNDSNAPNDPNAPNAPNAPNDPNDPNDSTA